MVHIEAKYFAHGRLDLLDARVAELKDLLTVLADQVVVLLVRVRLLKAGQVLAELMTGDQLRFQQQVNGIIQGGATDAKPFILHADKKRFDIEVFVHRVDLLQDSEALRGFSMPLGFEKSGEYLADFVDVGCAHEVGGIKPRRYGRR